jgi:hypothetical protein
VSVGSSLAEARQARGTSVEDVSAATRIRAGLIREMEADDFHACGGDVYARGHIRSIARTLGIDPGPLVAEFDSAHNAEPAVVPTVPPESDQLALAHAEPRRPNWTAAMVVALLLVIGVAAYGLISNTGTGTPTRNVVANGPVSTTPPPTSPAPQPSTSKTPSVPPSSLADAYNPNLAILQVRALSQSTWLQVTEASTGQVLFQNLLQPGQTKRFRSSAGLDFVIGNAPAVDLVVNGKDVGSPQSSGNVARGSIKPGARQVQQA